MQQRLPEADPHPQFSQHGLIQALRHPSLSLILGVAVGVTYAVPAAIASRYYPTVYSPFHNNTLSQLGNPDLNPHGAVYYLIGCGLSGAFAMAFFASLTHWRRTGMARQNRLLLLVQGLGMVGGFALIMNAVYPENHLTIHHFWAGVVFNSFGLALLLSPFAFRREERFHPSLTALSLLGALSVVIMYIFARDHWVEWLPVSLFLILPGVLGLHTALTHRER